MQETLREGGDHEVSGSTVFTITSRSPAMADSTESSIVSIIMVTTVF